MRKYFSSLVYKGTRYLVLLRPEKCHLIYNRIRTDKNK